MLVEMLEGDNFECRVLCMEEEVALQVTAKVLLTLTSKVDALPGAVSPGSAVVTSGATSATESFSKSVVNDSVCPA